MAIWDGSVIATLMPAAAPDAGTVKKFCPALPFESTPCVWAVLKFAAIGSPTSSVASRTWNHLIPNLDRASQLASLNCLGDVDSV